METIKPCPKCGSGFIMEDLTPYEVSFDLDLLQNFKITCKNKDCKFEVQESGESIEKVVKKWNRGEEKILPKRYTNASDYINR